MNILVPYTWLTEIIETNATAEDIQKYVSLSGPSVERIITKDGEDILNVEITTNRIDSASIIGFARECFAILPEYGFKVSYKNNQIFSKTNPIIEKKTNQRLTIIIDNETLCSRFTALIFDHVTIKESPDFIKKRLHQCEVNSINVIVDISNYLMLLFGQPVHMFDYDKIAGSLLRTRMSKKGESLITLDNEFVTLPGGDIIIEDGDKKIIDLCGIMGGLNSAISEKTKRIVFFLQTYNKSLIRRTSMITGKRTLASTYFEKGLDEEQINTVLPYGTNLIMKYAHAQPISEVYDIYPNPYSPKKITIHNKDIVRILNIHIPHDRIIKILSRLNFNVTYANEKFTVVVPSFRAKDIDMKEDIIEEIARIYGYETIPSESLPMVYVEQPEEDENIITFLESTRTYLKNCGGREIMSYSMYSKDEIVQYELSEKTHIRVSNALTKNIEYLRQSMIPSLLKAYIKNKTAGYDIPILFETSNVYQKNNTNIQETRMFSFISDLPFFTIKGYLETIFHDNYIPKIQQQIKNLPKQYITNVSFISNNSKQVIAEMGILSTALLQKYSIDKPITVVEMYVQNFIHAKNKRKIFTPYYPTARIHLEVTLKKKKLYSEITSDLDKMIQKNKDSIITYSFLSQFKNWLSFKFTFQKRDKNMTQSEAQSILAEIVKNFEIKK